MATGQYWLLLRGGVGEQWKISEGPGLQRLIEARVEELLEDHNGLQKARRPLTGTREAFSSLGRSRVFGEGRGPEAASLVHYTKRLTCRHWLQLVYLKGEIELNPPIGSILKGIRILIAAF